MTEAAVLMRYEFHVRPEAVPLGRLGRGAVAEDRPRPHRVEERWMSHLSGPLDMGQIAVAARLAISTSVMASATGARAGPRWPPGTRALPCRPAMQATATSAAEAAPTATHRAGAS